MARDESKVKKNTAGKVIPNNKGAETPQPSNEDPKSTRGWKDVFDNSTYSSGPGDNIYVFG